MASSAVLAVSSVGGPATDVGRIRAALSLAVRRGLGLVFGVSWVVNIGLLVAAGGCIYFIGESRETIELMKRAVWSRYATGGGDILDPSRLGMGVAAGLVGVAVALVACVAMLASLF